MILDRHNRFSWQQRVDASGATPSTDVIDLGPLAAGNADRDIGQGVPPIFLVIQSDEIPAGTGATVTFSLQTDDNEAFNSATTLWSSAAIAKADLVAGYRVVAMPLPRGCEKYLRVVYTTNNTMETTGKFSAYLTFDVQDNKSYVAGKSN